MTVTTESTTSTLQKGSFWRQDEPVRDESGTIIRGGMWPHQRAFWNLPNFVKALITGYGGGKTLIGGKRAISLLMNNAPVPGAIVSPTFPMARETTITTVSELLNGKETILGRDGFRWEYKKQERSFIVYYRGRIGRAIVYSGDDPARLKGPNLAWAWVDEPFIQDVEVFRQLMARLRHPAATMLELILTGTPEQLNWGWELCEGELSDRHDVGFIQASSRANLATGGAYIDRLSGTYDGKAAEAYIEGQFVNLVEGLVYYAFSADANVQPYGLIDEVEIGAGMDFNVNPMSAAVFWRHGEHIHFFDEIELPNSDTQPMCVELRNRYGQRLINVYPDPSGNARHTNAPAGETAFTTLSRNGFIVNAHSRHPKRRDRFNAVNGKMKAQSGNVTLTFEPSCKKLIRYMRQYSHEQMNTEEQKAMSHLLDARDYAVEYLYPIGQATRFEQW